jgi:hypothetical protein
MVSALVETERLRLSNNHFYFPLLSELYSGIDTKKAKSNLQKAYSLAKTQTEKQGIQGRIDKFLQLLSVSVLKIPRLVGGVLASHLHKNIQRHDLELRPEPFQNIAHSSHATAFAHVHG